MLQDKPLAATPTFSPLYRQIETLLLQRLEAGEWRPGSAIPSEAELAVRFGVSQGTVRKAIDEMVAEKLLVRRQGKGTYVASHHDAGPRESFRFLRLVSENGPPEELQSIPLECWRAKAGHEASRTLGVAFGAPITIVRRLLRFSGKPTVVEEIYLPGDLVVGLDLEMLQDFNGSFTVSGRVILTCRCFMLESIFGLWRLMPLPPVCWRSSRIHRCFRSSVSAIPMVKSRWSGVGGGARQTLFFISMS